MPKQNRKSGAKISTSDITEALIDIALENRSKDKRLVKVREIQTWLKIRKNISVSAETVRNNGLCHKGYYEKKYPDSCSYNYQGNTNYRGLIIKPQRFLKEVAQK